MNRLIKGLIASLLIAGLIYAGFIGYVSIKVNQEVTDLGIRQLQSQIDYLNEQQIRDNIDNDVEFTQFQNDINKGFSDIFDILEILEWNNNENLMRLHEYLLKNFETIFEELREPDIDLLLKSSVIVQTPTSSGSGTAIKKSNGFTYILTCYHVIKERPLVIEEEIEPSIIIEAIELPEQSQTNITISYLLKNEDNEEIGNVMYGAEIVEYDEKKDLALLKIFVEDENLNAVSIAKEEPKIGDTVYSIGNPLSTNRVLSKGILSTKEEGFYISDNTTSFGSSGGGLFNNKGELIGVPSNVIVYFFGIPEATLGLSRNLNTITDFLKGIDY